MKCQYCNSETVRRGSRYNRSGRKQLYLCKKCRRKSTPEWPRMRFAKRDVMHAVRLYKSGMSSGKTQSLLAANGVKVSRWTILKWYRKFG